MKIALSQSIVPLMRKIQENHGISFPDEQHIMILKPVGETHRLIIGMAPVEVQSIITWVDVDGIKVHFDLHDMYEINCNSVVFDVAGGRPEWSVGTLYVGMHEIES